MPQHDDYFEKGAGDAFVMSLSHDARNWGGPLSEGAGVETLGYVKGCWGIPDFVLQFWPVGNVPDAIKLAMAPWIHTGAGASAETLQAYGGNYYTQCVEARTLHWDALNYESTWNPGNFVALAAGTLAVTITSTLSPSAELGNALLPAADLAPSVDGSYTDHSIPPADGRAITLTATPWVQDPMDGVTRNFCNDPFSIKGVGNITDTTTLEAAATGGKGDFTETWAGAVPPPPAAQSIGYNAGAAEANVTALRTDLSIPLPVGGIFVKMRERLFSKKFSDELTWPGAGAFTGKGFYRDEHDGTNGGGVGDWSGANVNGMPAASGAEASEALALPWRDMNGVGLTSEVDAVSGFIFYPTINPHGSGLDFNTTGKWFSFRSRFGVDENTTGWDGVNKRVPFFIGVYRQSWHAVWTLDEFGLWQRAFSFPAPLVSLYADNLYAQKGESVELPFPGVGGAPPGAVWELPTVAATGDPVWLFWYFVVIGQASADWATTYGYTFTIFP